jgi:hypothetical protein
MGTRNRFSVARCCCEEVPPPCEHCDTDTDPGDSLVVSFDGWQNGSTSGCDCSFFNDTFILDRAELNPCFWGTIGWANLGCYYSQPALYKIGALLWDSGGKKRWSVTMEVGPRGFYFLWAADTIGPIDCEANRVLGFLEFLQTGSSQPWCANWENVICEVNP